MAEFSLPWSGAVLGDCGPYTDVQWGMVNRALASSSGQQGVTAYTGMNGLEITRVNANTISVNTGCAVVDGKVYYNDVAKQFAIASAAPGNWRYDRMVLRCNWSTQEARLYGVAGVESAYPPTLPTVSRVSEALFDLYLYNVIVNDTGIPSNGLTDEREWAIPPSGFMPGYIFHDDTIDDEKVQYRIPTVPYRQGGHATNWSGDATSDGGSTDYVPDRVMMIPGFAAVTFGAGQSVATLAISFGENFAHKPIVFVSDYEEWFPYILKSRAKTVSTSGFTLSVTSDTPAPGGGMIVCVPWFAVGEKAAPI